MKESNDVNSGVTKFREELQRWQLEQANLTRQIEKIGEEIDTVVESIPTYGDLELTRVFMTYKDKAHSLFMNFNNQTKVMIKHTEDNIIASGYTLDEPATVMDRIKRDDIQIPRDNRIYKPMDLKTKDDFIQRVSLKIDKYEAVTNRPNYSTGDAKTCVIEIFSLRKNPHVGEQTAIIKQMLEQRQISKRKEIKEVMRSNENLDEVMPDVDEDVIEDTIELKEDEEVPENVESEDLSGSR